MLNVIGFLLGFVIGVWIYFKFIDKGDNDA